MKLAEKLDYHYKAFNKTKISPDPLQFLHLFKNERDIEVIGFLASVFAYGNVKQINNTLQRIRTIVKNKPYSYVVKFAQKDYKDFQGFIHRFYSQEDIVSLFLVLKDVFLNYGSLKNLFLTFYNPHEPNLKDSVSKFSNHLVDIVKKENNQQEVRLGVMFMFPLPEKGSACKRMNLFLRWMVRKDDLDFGLWSEIPTNKLVIPVDTHIAAPTKPITAAKISSAVRFSPCSFNQGSTPSTLKLTESTSTMAKLVARKRMTRFMRGSPESLQ